MHGDTRAYTNRDSGSSLELCNRMLDSLKILMNGETETMECFVLNVSASVLPERIFLSEPGHSTKMCVCVVLTKLAYFIII